MLLVMALIRFIDMFINLMCTLLIHRHNSRLCYILFRMLIADTFFFFNDTATPEIYTYSHTLSLHDALPIFTVSATPQASCCKRAIRRAMARAGSRFGVVNLKMNFTAASNTIALSQFPWRMLVRNSFALGASPESNVRSFNMCVRC